MSGIFMHRFITSQSLTDKFSLSSGDEQFHQIVRVFRAKKGDKVIFFEAGWDDIVYEIINIEKKGISFAKRERIAQTSKKWGKITIFQALPNKIATVEIIVQKLVEIGIDEIVFFASEYSQMRAFPPNKMLRVSSIAKEALEQSGRNIPIEIHYEQGSLEDLFQENTNIYHIIWFPSGEDNIILNKKNDVGLWIGPEGWWSQKEKDFFINNDCPLWSFSNNILRLETASITGAGILSYLLRI
jgi:16S rRNA (uracil1498-N3)-methyltransferase